MKQPKRLKYIKEIYYLTIESIKKKMRIQTHAIIVLLLTKQTVFNAGL